MNDTTLQYRSQFCLSRSGSVIDPHVRRVVRESRHVQSGTGAGWSSDAKRCVETPSRSDSLSGCSVR